MRRRISLVVLLALLGVSVGAQQRVFRLVGTQVESETHTVSDLTYLGALRVADNVDNSFNYGAITGRYVSGVHHLIYYTNVNRGAYPIEVIDPGPAGYNTNYTLASRATIYKIWGDAYGVPDKRKAWYTSGGMRGQEISFGDHLASGIWWDRDTSRLYTSWWTSYNVLDYPLWNLLFATLNDGTLVATGYGPFHVDVGTQRSFYMGPDPFDSSKMGVGGAIESGGVTAAPQGPSYWGGVVKPDTTTPAGWPTAPTGDPEPDIVSGHVLLDSPYMGSDNGIPTSQFDIDGNLVGVNRALRRPEMYGNPNGDFYWHAASPNPHMDPLKNNGDSAFTTSDRIHDSELVQGTNKSSMMFTGGFVGHPGVTLPQVGTIDAAGHTVDWTLTNTEQYAAVRFTGTWVGTLAIKCTTDNMTWSALDGHEGSLGAPTFTGSTTTTNRALWINPTGCLQLRAEATAWTSGEVTVTFTDCLAHLQYLSGVYQCSHGCACLACATGPSYTNSFPVLLIYSLASLQAVRNDVTASYVPTPEIIDLRQTFNLQVSTTQEGGFNAMMGGLYYDPTSQRLYMFAGNADTTSDFGATRPLIHVFAVDDSATPQPWAMLLLAAAFVASCVSVAKAGGVA